MKPLPIHSAAQGPSDGCAAPIAGVPRIRRRARAGDARFLLQFGGQGSPFLPELTRLYREHGAICAPFFDMCFAVLADVQARADVRAEPARYFPHGFELRDWLRGERLPPADSLFECPISFPATTMLQLGLLYAVARSAYPLEELGYPTIATTGHSQGILAASVFSLAAGASPDDYLRICYDWLLWFSVSGLYIKREYRPAGLTGRDLEFSQATDGARPTAMAVLFGPETGRIAEWILAWSCADEAAGDPIEIALINSPTVHVLAGHARDLCRFRRQYLQEFIKFDYDWEYLAVSAPFHSGPHLRAISRAFAADGAYTSLRYRGDQLRVPLVSFVDGKDMRGGSSLVDELAEILFHGRLDWNLTMRSIHENFVSPTHVLDFGPGRASATLTRKFYESLSSPAPSPGSPVSPVEIFGLNRGAGLRSFLA